MATNMAEVLKLVARPTLYNKDERTWLEFRFKLENNLTLVNERYVQLLQDAQPQPFAYVPARTDEGSVLIRTVSHTLYALLATLTTGRSLRMVQRAPNRNGFAVWGQLVAEKRTEDSGSKVRDVASCPAAGPVKFEEVWNAWEHQVDVYEKLATSKLDDDVKISEVLREAPTKLRDNLLVNSQQFESNYNKLRAIIQAYLNTNMNWTAHDFRNDTKGSDPMEDDCIRQRQRQEQGQRQGDEA